MWQTENNRAQWNQRLQIDVAAPEQGIVPALQLQPANAAGFHLLRVCSEQGASHCRLELVETYVRGTDCVATYAPLKADQIQPQIYWRGMTDLPADCVGMELLVSMQTSLLDSDPTIRITSELPRGEALSWVHGKWQLLPEQAWLERQAGQSDLLLVRPADCQWSYAQAVFPSDIVRAESSQTETHVIWSHLIFAERLEKGVIRRGRVAGWLLPRANDEQLAVELCEAFYNSPPPLGT